MSFVSIQQSPTNKLLLVISQLPFTDYIRFVVYDILAAIQLSRTCRLLYDKIQNNRVLWQRLYHHQFFNGLHINKEWDFVDWYARIRSISNDTLAESTTILDQLNWYEIYCQRVITEQNWRYNRSKHITIPLPAPGGDRYCNFSKSTATTVLAIATVSYDTVEEYSIIWLNERVYLSDREKTAIRQFGLPQLTQLKYANNKPIRKRIYCYHH
jgi:hypothetical protein